MIEKKIAVNCKAFFFMTLRFAIIFRLSTRDFFKNTKQNTRKKVWEIMISASVACVCSLAIFSIEGAQPLYIC